MKVFALKSMDGVEIVDVAITERALTLRLTRGDPAKRATVQIGLLACWSLGTYPRPEGC